MLPLTPDMRAGSHGAPAGAAPMTAGAPSAVPSAAAPTSADGKPKENELSSLFTTLLVAQIQNQDPLAPMEASQFVTQFAQMNQIEVMQSLVSTSNANAALQESMLVVSLGSQVGSQVMAVTGSAELGTEPVHGGMVLAHASSDLQLVLTGADGVEHRVPLGAKDAGDVRFTLNPAEHGLAPGQYTLRVSTETGEKPLVEMQGELKSVRLGLDGKVILSVAGIGEADTASITRFLGRPNAAGPTPSTRKGFWS
ncbi:flagellar hook capping FlgD N-terminal domain-containing protein [Paraburkholderia bonniea]|uniref:flagellar hook capping FlgD N-terminal domain-containing protein n=1 Tax=Paraburkholderia bonniea TaxID=2152891 RepID=UPI001290AD96|nr:flagellar hook capping FlgD N-terminal domain-containing protein [Paraburkholderia bonniea]WJF90791.1 flagellar hook capping FlgD N-terminal domain-containing protein [Paraburkholderia bonniea]WJF94105.1 flagellar hook capping FlgD N-terminal domain-containing protein [Paraburkholderia bonniea]